MSRPPRIATLTDTVGDVDFLADSGGNRGVQSTPECGLRGHQQIVEPIRQQYPDGSGYLVRNDVTGEIVQVSDRFDPNWIAPWDPPGP